METEEKQKPMSIDEFFINRLNQLLKEKQLSRYKLSMLSGLTQSSLSVMLSGRSAPSLASLDKLCKGLDMSIADFFSENELEYYLSSDDKKMISYWRQLTETQKLVMLSFIEGMLAQSKLDNK